LAHARAGTVAAASTSAFSTGARAILIHQYDIQFETLKYVSKQGFGLRRFSNRPDVGAAGYGQLPNSERDYLSGKALNNR
jgi:hypothetical protein